VRRGVLPAAGHPQGQGQLPAGGVLRLCGHYQVRREFFQGQGHLLLGGVRIASVNTEHF